MLNINVRKNPKNNMLILPTMLGMEKTIELTGARLETFFYRSTNKRLIDYKVINDRRWSKISGPLLYAVTDKHGYIRYIGKWVTESALYCRWVRHKAIHHQESARNLYIAELDANRGPLSVWSVSIAELRPKLPTTMQGLTNKAIAKGLEALWIQRWRDQLRWNTRIEPVTPGFDDGNFWVPSNPLF